MADLLLTSEEHKLLKKFQERLQNRYNVKIHTPDTVASAESDIIFSLIDGEKHNIECVKKFLSEKMSATTEKVVCKENITVIILSDSEEEQISSLESEESSGVENLSSPENSFNFVDQLTTCKPLDNFVYKIESPIPESSSKLSRRIRNGETGNKEKWKKRNSKMKNKKVRSKGVLPSSQPFEEAELCEVSSTTEEVVPKQVKFCKETTKEFITNELSEFIPLQSNRKSHFDEIESSTNSHDNLSKEQNDDIIVLDEPSSAPRPLRPVVIDGSNVAREHGKVTQTYSAKGIQLAVDYFLNRGHMQVTAFVPKFRRHCSNGNFPTTDPEILNDLEKKQHVVFTPSRRLKGKCINSYDDRFIVQLASTNSGIIVSNDNFRDLAEENDSFKDAIENRLLMFCFVGDMFMVPSDPLGRDGPTLNDFLSFPPDHETS